MKRHVLTSFAAIAALALTYTAAAAQQSGRDQQAPAASESRGSATQDRRARDDAPSGQKTTGQGERSGAPARAQSGPPDEMPPAAGKKAGQADGDRGRGGQDAAKDASKDASKDAPKDTSKATGQAEQDRGSAKTRQSRDRDEQGQSRRSGDRMDRDRTGRDRGERTTTQRDRGDRTTTQRDRGERTTQEPSGRQDRDARTGSDDARREGSQSRESTSRRDRDARGSASMSQEDRTQVSARFSARIDSMNVRPLSRTSISISVGRPVSRSVTLYDVPRDVVTIYPQYRGHKFVVVEDEIVIIEPRSRRVVTTLPRSGGPRQATSTTTRTTGMREGGIRLSDSQRQVIRTTIMREPRCRTETRIDFVLFVPLPRSVEVCEFPAQLVSDVPEMRSYRYLLRGDEIVIVDPREHHVVEVID